MADEQVEAVKIKRIGVLSLAGTFAFISLFVSILFAIIVALGLSLIASLLKLPLLISYIDATNLIIFVIGSFVMTFVSFLILGLFYNLSAKITKGIKLYS